MRTIFVLGAIAIALSAAGVIHLTKNGDQVDISIDKNKLRQTTAKVIEEGKHFVDEAEQAVEQNSDDSNHRSFLPLSTRP